jgi:DNA-binding MarR family transcriptional regulator
VTAPVRAPSRVQSANGRAPSSPIDDDVAAFVEALDAAQYLLRSIADAALSELGGGITATQLRLLERLQRLGESRLIDLADALAIAPSTATRLCDALADRQMIVRHRRGRDRRELQIRLTERGAALLESVRSRTGAGWSDVLERVSTHDRKEVAAILSRLSGVVDRAEEAQGQEVISA